MAKESSGDGAIDLSKLNDSSSKSDDSVMSSPEVVVVEDPIIAAPKITDPKSV